MKYLTKMRILNKIEDMLDWIEANNGEVLAVILLALAFGIIATIAHYSNMACWGCDTTIYATGNWGWAPGAGYTGMPPADYCSLLLPWRLS